MATNRSFRVTIPGHQDVWNPTNICYLLKRSHALTLDGIVPALAARGFTFMQFAVLIHLRDGIEINPRDICFELRYDSGAITRVIDHLVERGFLDRARCLRDRRRVNLRLTDAGRKALESLIPTVVNQANAALHDFSTAEVRELSRLLNKLNDKMYAELGCATALRRIVATPVATQQRRQRP